MTDKNGTLRQRRNTLFPKVPATGMHMCPFKGPNLAIVPMRYALDRSRHDPQPDQLTPLHPEGQWHEHPPLRTRAYTLRQLRDGYLYVFDESAKTLHEYRYSAQDATLTHLPSSGDGPSLIAQASSHLLYPRNHLLHLAYTPQPWSGRLREQLSADPDSRARWMRRLDLKTYSNSMTGLGVMPIADLADAVADIDSWPIRYDQRFADSAYPPESGDGSNAHCVPLACDVVWRGCIDDVASAVFVALDDPLAVLEDLGMQLSTEQAALQHWQNEHEHALNIAAVVEQLCGAGVDPAQLPAAVKDDEARTREYVRDLEAWYEQLDLEEDANRAAQDGLSLDILDLPSRALAQRIKQRYGGLPDPALRASWQARGKWRRQADSDAARAYADARRPESEALLRQLRDSLHDLQRWAERIGTDPRQLGIDTGHDDSLLYLQGVISGLLEILAQDLSLSRWLAQEEASAKTLFGLARFGFNAALKSAFDAQANALVQGAGDVTSLVGRSAELNSFLGHERIAEKPWVKALSEPARQTLDCLVRLARGTGKAVFENTLLALLPVDSRLAYGQKPDLAALLRNLLIGHVLLDHPDRLKVDQELGTRLQDWKQKLLTARADYRQTQNAWFYHREKYDRKALSRLLLEMEQELKQLALAMPALIDYQNNRYVEIVRNGIRGTVERGGLTVAGWHATVRAWSEKQGVNAGAITWGVVMANLINTLVTYRTLSQDGELTAKDWAKIGSATAYTGNAMMALWVETKWAGMKGLSTLIKDVPTAITEKSAAYWSSTTGDTRGWGKLIRGFGGRLVGLGGFALIATSAELWDLWDDFSHSTSSKKLLITKMLSVSAMFVIGTIQFSAGFLALTGSPILLSFAMSSGIAGAALIAGAVYLISSTLINYLKTDAVGQWLRKGTWSRHPKDRLPATPEGRAEEVRAFLEIQLSPTLFVKPSYTLGRHSFPHGDYMNVRIQDGAWVQLQVPAPLRNAVLRVNLTASHHPFLVMPTTKLDGELQEHFVDHGRVESVSIMGDTPKNRWNRNEHAVFGFPMMPPEGEDIVWHTWVPLDEKAQYLELQVWYPEEILSSGEGDRGYRYQLELDEQGVKDQKDTRMSGLDTSTLQVQTLGGREDAIVLPIPS